MKSLAKGLAVMALLGTSKTAEALSTQDKVRGTYENRIRFFAAPEKIFETFAGTKKEGKLYLSYGDFFKAVTPFSYAPIKDMEGYLESHKVEALRLADCNNDGLISFPEFLFFVTLLQIPDETLAAAFAANEPRDRLSK